MPHFQCGYVSSILIRRSIKEYIQQINFKHQSFKLTILRAKRCAFCTITTCSETYLQDSVLQKKFLFILVKWVYKGTSSVLRGINNCTKTLSELWCIRITASILDCLSWGKGSTPLYTAHIGSTMDLTISAVKSFGR